MMKWELSLGFFNGLGHAFSLSYWSNSINKQKIIIKILGGCGIRFYFFGLFQVNLRQVIPVKFF